MLGATPLPLLLLNVIFYGYFSFLGPSFVAYHQTVAKIQQSEVDQDIFGFKMGALHTFTEIGEFAVLQKHSLGD